MLIISSLQMARFCALCDLVNLPSDAYHMLPSLDFSKQLQLFIAPQPKNMNMKKKGKLPHYIKLRKQFLLVCGGSP